MSNSLQANVLLRSPVLAFPVALSLDQVTQTHISEWLLFITRFETKSRSSCSNYILGVILYYYLVLQDKLLQIMNKWILNCSSSPKLINRSSHSFQMYLMNRLSKPPNQQKLDRLLGEGLIKNELCFFMNIPYGAHLFIERIHLIRRNGLVLSRLSGILLILM